VEYFKKKLFVLLLAIGFLFFVNGCAVLNIPFKIASGIIGGVLNVTKTVVSIANKLPKPPPGAF